MSKHYNPKSFFRDVPAELLQQYFKNRNVLETVEFENPKLSKRKLADAIYQAWLELPDELRGSMEQDFQEIHEMSTEGGTKIILDEAAWHDEDLAEFFSKMESFHERAFWTFLERKKYWDKANILNHIEMVSERSWKKHNNLPQKPVNVLPEAIKSFEKQLANYFHKVHGKGRNCEIIPLRRGDIDYFIGYPEDCTQSSMEWHNQILTNRAHRPAFETIFAFNEKQGTLEIYCTRSNKRAIEDLQAIFATVILGVNLADHEHQPNKFVYDLSPLMDRNFQFKYDFIKSGIKSVTVHKLSLFIPSDGRKMILYGNIKRDKKDIYSFLDETGKAIHLSQVIIKQVGIKVNITDPHKPNSTKTVSFDVTYPNSCTLRHTELNLPIRQMLIDTGIEPKPALNNDQTEVEEDDDENS